MKREPKTVGTRVRFLLEGLGASRRDDLSHFTRETYGVEDEGVIAFAHPNPSVRTVGWVFVEVASKECPGEKRYVAVRSGMFAAIVPAKKLSK